MAEPYGARTGVTTLRVLVHTLCRLYIKFSTSILRWVNLNVSDAEQRAVVVAWLAAISAVCVILEATPDD